MKRITPLFLLAFAFVGSATFALADPPEAPSNLGVGLKKKSPHSLFLQWKDNSVGESGFIVYRATVTPFGTVFGPIAIVGQNVTAFVDNGVDGSHAYYYFVTAFNGDGESGASNVVGPIAPFNIEQ